MEGLALLYITVPDETTGQDMARAMIEKKLIACANLFAPHTAIYEWQGSVETEQEHVMILKTTQSQAAAAEEYVVNNHPYDTPCVIQIDPSETHPDFLSWVNSTVS